MSARTAVEVRIHRLAWCALAAVLALASCRAPEATTERVIEYRTPVPEVTDGNLDSAVRVREPGGDVEQLDGGRTVYVVSLAGDGVLVADVPTPEATAVPPPPAPTAVAAQVTGEIADWLRAAGWAEGLLSQAIAVTWCESRHNPAAIGDHGDSLGLFQVQWTPRGWRGWYAWAVERGVIAPGESWDSPVSNAKVAWAIYQQSGWSQWSCRWAAG